MTSLTKMLIQAVVLCGLAHDMMACLTMPLELCNYAQRAGAKEIPGFYSTELGYHLPPFSYGLLAGEHSESAAMLVSSGKNQYQILTVKRLRRVGGPAKLLPVYPPLVLDHDPHGLRIDRGRFKTLKRFACVSDTEKSSSSRIPSDLPVIVCEYDGEEESYVFLEGEWWGHFLND